MDLRKETTSTHTRRLERKTNPQKRKRRTRRQQASSCCGFSMEGSIAIAACALALLVVLPGASWYPRCPGTEDVLALCAEDVFALCAELLLLGWHFFVALWTLYCTFGRANVKERSTMVMFLWLGPHFEFDALAIRLLAAMLLFFACLRCSIWLLSVCGRLVWEASSSVRSPPEVMPDRAERRRQQLLVRKLLKRRWKLERRLPKATAWDMIFKGLRTVCVLGVSWWPMEVGLRILRTSTTLMVCHTYWVLFRCALLVHRATDAGCVLHWVKCRHLSGAGCVFWNCEWSVLGWRGKPLQWLMLAQARSVAAVRTHEECNGAALHVPQRENKTPVRRGHSGRRGTER